MAKASWKNIILESTENSGFLNFVQNNFRGSGQSLYTLTYHRVDEINHRPWLDPHLISATPHQFEEQMRLVATRYHPISAEDLVDAVHGGPPLPKDAVLVTVDDGYLDFKEVIFPFCSRFGIRPLLFMPTAYVGQGTYWWDKVFQIIHQSGRHEIDSPMGRLLISTEQEKNKSQDQLIEALKRMPDNQMTEWVDTTHESLVELSEEKQCNTLNWEELAELVQAGISVASHTHTHPIMTRISIEEARQQAFTSQELIRQKLGVGMPIFAFPDGKSETFNSGLVKMLHSEGFEILFLLLAGRALIRPGNQKLVLPRISVWQSQSLPQFHMRLTPLVGRLRPDLID